jgi:thiol-disulfide isomerase/thioredoxin
VDASVLTGAGVAAGALLAATGLGLWRLRRDGHPREAPADEGDALDPDLLASLGVAPGAGVTLLQFSSAFCAPCRTTRVVCAEVAKALDGVRHVEVDAESHLAAVRALGVWRTPTVLVLDPAGQVVRRAVGAPTRAQVLAAVAASLPAEEAA